MGDEKREPVDVDGLVKLATEAKSRRAAATQGPYFINHYDNEDGSVTWQVQSENDAANVIAHVQDCDHPKAKGTALFIAAAERDVPTLADGVLALAAENARLRRFMLRDVPSFGPFDQAEDGTVSVGVADGHWVTRFLVGAMAGLLEGKGGGARAPNYIQIGGWHPETGRIECIIQRAGKLSPHEARGEAERHLARAVALLAEHGIPWEGPTTFLPDPPPERERGPAIEEDTPWCRIDARPQPNELFCTRCDRRQEMPERGTAPVLEAMMKAFALAHADCQEGDATMQAEKLVPRG